MYLKEECRSTKSVTSSLSPSAAPLFFFSLDLDEGCSPELDSEH